MHEQDVALIGQLIDDLSESEDVLVVLVNRGTLPETWREIGCIFRSIRMGLSEIENEMAITSLSLGASLG